MKLAIYVVRCSFDWMSALLFLNRSAYFCIMSLHFAHHPNAGSVFGSPICIEESLEVRALRSLQHQSVGVEHGDGTLLTSTWYVIPLLK